MKHTFPRAINLVKNKKVNLSSLVTHRFPLNDIVEAFKLNLAYNDRVVKVIIEN
jgi:threonine dehydrogenase-like Zn-dependent dehydrogenase